MLEKADKPEEAIRTFKLYLLAAPNAPDAREVKKKIAGLKYKQEKFAKKRQEETQRAKLEEQQRTDKTRKIPQLSGTWYNPKRNNRYHVTATANAIEIVHSALYFRGQWHSQDANRGCSGSDTWRGTIEGSTIRGSWSRNWACLYKNGRMFTNPMKGTISEDGNTISLKFTATGPAGAVGDIADGWMEWINEQILTR